MKTEQQIIALAGLSGAGKSTLLRELSDEYVFEHFSASSLIKEQKAFELSQNSSSEDLRKGNISDNQRLFKTAFQRHCMRAGASIVFDCHTLIDTPQGIEILPFETFEGIGLSAFAFLSVEPAELLRRRREDVGRGRPNRSAAQLEEQQITARDQGVAIAQHLDIPFLLIESKQTIAAIAVLLQLRSRTTP